MSKTSERLAAIEQRLDRIEGTHAEPFASLLAKHVVRDMPIGRNIRARGEVEVARVYDVRHSDPVIVEGPLRSARHGAEGLTLDIAGVTIRKAEIL